MITFLKAFIVTTMTTIVLLAVTVPFLFIA